MISSTSLISSYFIRDTGRAFSQPSGNLSNSFPDGIVGDQHKTGVHTEVERVSRLLFAHPVPHIRAQETCLAQLSIFGSLPKQARQSTTLDNGSENYLHTQLQEELGIRTYFAHPYCS